MEALIKYTAFEGNNLLFRGALSEVVLNIKKRLGKADNCSILIFSDTTGMTLDFNFQGNSRDVLKRLGVFVSETPPTYHADPTKTIGAMGPGRPKLGVICREVSLLPRHWEWLATQSGGASATLRSLVEEAKKKTAGASQVKQAQDRTYKFMSVIAGDFEGYEEALRALYKRDKKTFLSKIHHWAPDVRNYVAEIAKSVFYLE